MTTLDAKLARTMEPRASTPPRRLEALRQLVKAGVPASTLVAPVIPAINDAEIERILEAVAATGVRHAGYVLLRLPLEVRDLFREWLMANFPDRYRHVFKLIRDMRGGKDYDSTFGMRMTGSGPIAWMIGRRFEVACERLGFNATSVKTTTAHFRPPQPAVGAAQSVRVDSGPRSTGRFPAILRLARPRVADGAGAWSSWRMSRTRKPRRAPAARRGDHPADVPPRACGAQARACGRWPDAMKPDAARSPGRWSPPP